jgi:hypothetical protein
MSQLMVVVLEYYMSVPDMRRPFELSRSGSASSRGGGSLPWAFWSAFYCGESEMKEKSEMRWRPGAMGARFGDSCQGEKEKTEEEWPDMGTGSLKGIGAQGTDRVCVLYISMETESTWHAFDSPPRPSADYGSLALPLSLRSLPTRSNQSTLGRGDEPAGHPHSGSK